MKVSLKERISFGIAFIKGVYGPDALKKIDAQTLSLADGDSCVLGQLGGGYGKEIARLKLTRTMAYLFGFIATPKVDSLSPAKEELAFNALDKGWQKEVNKAV